MALGACADTGVLADISYDDRFGDATTMDIHMPAGAATQRPTIMLIHGGAWRTGDKTAYTDAAEGYAAAGYVAATINYRLAPANPYPAAVKDCLCALSFLRANADQYGIDPARIAVSGYSAGGHLSALIAVASDAPEHQPDCAWGPTAPPAAVIPGDGGYDFRSDTGSELFGWIGEFLGGSRDAVPDNYTSASPIVYVRASAPPALVIHGLDDVASLDGARAYAAALRDAGASVRMLEIEGAGHLSSAVTATDGIYLQAATDTPESRAVTFDFLARTIGAP